MEKENPAPQAGGNRAGFGMRAGTEFSPNYAPIQESKPRLRLIEWRPFHKNSQRGFVTMELPVGLAIADISVHVSHGKAWASLPAKPQMNADGTARRGEDGKVQYIPILKWRDRELADRFSAAVVQAVEAQHGPLA